MPISGRSSSGAREARAGRPSTSRRRKRTGAPQRAERPLCRELALDLDDVRRLQTLRTLGRLVLDLRTLGEGLEAVAGDAREVHEEIGASVGRRDEAVALGI